MQSKKSKGTVQKAKDKAWRSFSRFIRLRDCYRTSRDTDKGICITCGKLISFKEGQAGHFIAGRTNAVLFDEDMVHLQCYKCNVCNHGEQLEYYYALKRLGYTEDELDKMRQQRYITKKYTAEDYNEIAQQYNDRYEDIITAYNLNRSLQKLVELPHHYKECKK